MQPLPSSYRDRDGFVFRQDGKIYRVIRPSYEIHYARLMSSGLYDELAESGKLIAHREITEPGKFGITEGRLLLPEQVPFISYPYEWSFDMYKDAALLTLKIAMLAVKKEMILKDATPFNIQFMNGKPVFIDTLSFENYEEGGHWAAYRQFCECFLAPLLLMHYCHPDSNKLFTVNPNGIPMDVLASLLPKRSKWNLNTMLHVHLHAKISGKPKQGPETKNNFSKKKLELLLKGLESFVQKLVPRKMKTAWNDYYSCTILGNDYLQAKSLLVQSFTSNIVFKDVIDLGANDGHFSLLFEKDKKLIAADADPNCVNELYLKIKKERITNILPLISNLLAPSPAIGWANAERDSLTARLKTDLVLALALIHHLAIANNVPLGLIANWLAHMGEYLIIEFVPKSDEKVKLLLQNRKDIFDDYNLANFRSVFSSKYGILKEERLADTGRILFLMKRT